MPSTEELIPYLQEIDKDRWYTNFGPRLNSFECRLAAHFNVDRSHVVTTSSATTGLMLALRSSLPPWAISKTNFTCLLPGWTFVASAQAILEAGGVPVFCDVDPITGTLTPSIVLKYLSDPTSSVPDIIMPVVPFGGRAKVSEWDEVKRQTGIPVVIDAAASFYSFESGESPSVISLHATKSFGVGEGGVVVCRDVSLAKKVRQASQFGFHQGRKALLRGGNYKLSEYHAAVGLAQFDRQDKVKERYLFVRHKYVGQLLTLDGVTCFPDELDKITSTVNIMLRGYKADAVRKKLKQQGIGAAVWWEDKLHKNPVMRLSGEHFNLPNTDHFYENVVALPFNSRMDSEQVSRILKVVQSLVK